MSETDAKVQGDMRFVGSVALATGACMALVHLSAGAVGLGKETEVHLSPQVNGVITMAGDPVQNAYVYRTLDYGQEYLEETRTDEAGRFHFSARTIQSHRPGRLLDETRVRQVIGLVHDGKKYLLWYHTPGTIRERTAVSQRLGDMHCELTTPEKELLFRNPDKPEFPHAAFSICRWNDGLEMESLEDVELSPMTGKSAGHG